MLTKQEIEDTMDMEIVEVKRPLLSTSTEIEIHPLKPTVNSKETKSASAKPNNSQKEETVEQNTKLLEILVVDDSNPAVPEGSKKNDTKSESTTTKSCNNAPAQKGSNDVKSENVSEGQKTEKKTAPSGSKPARARSNPFTDKDVKLKFLKRFYLVLFMQLLLSFFIFVGFQDAAQSAGSNVELVAFVCILLFVVTAMFVMVSDAARHRPPFNYLVLFFLTIAMSVFFGVLVVESLYHETLFALSTTLFITLGLLVYTHGPFGRTMNFYQSSMYITIFTMLFLVGHIMFFAPTWACQLNSLGFALIAVFYNCTTTVRALVMASGCYPVALRPSDYVFAVILIYVDLMRYFGGGQRSEMFSLVGAMIALIVLFVYKLLQKDPAPVFGVYTVPGKWYYLKYLLFACFYYFRKLKNRHKSAGRDGRAGQGVRALADPTQMDRAQLLSDHSKAFDAVFFISASRNDEDKGIYVIAGCERRPMSICNGLFYIGLPGKGLLCSKKIPDTVLFGAGIGDFAADGLRIVPLEPMQRWSVSYKGQMWYQNDPSKIVDVDFQGEWSATTDYFDFDTDLYPPTVIRSIAREKWTRGYFEKLKTAHQSHYEQFGIQKCKIKIENESFEFTLPAFRDHSFGHKRDWSLMHRYAFHHIFLQNGTSISVGVICHPSTVSVFEAGEIALPSGKILPIKWVDLKLYQHGEGGEAPRDYAFQFQAGNEVYTVQVLVEYESVHYVSQDWEARMVERFCKFIVNGIPGRGVSEFHYRHTDGRPEEVGKSDPEWYRKMCHQL